MTVEFWIDQKFNTDHECEALEHFWTTMLKDFGQKEEPYFVLINFFVDDVQVDFTILKQNAVIVIELKECHDPFTASSNGCWLTIPHGKPVGNVKRNPFAQVRDYRIKWINFLKRQRQEFLEQVKGRVMNFDQVSAFVAISPQVHANTDRTKLPDSAWFQLVGLDTLSQAIEKKTSQFNFSPEELRRLVATGLNLRPVSTIADVYTNYGYFKEAQYPATHLSDHIQAIEKVIKKNNSLLVLGLSGSGKSNVLRYLVANPAVQSPEVTFVYIDCNQFDWSDDKQGLQEEICQQIIDDLIAQNLGEDLRGQVEKPAKHSLKSLIKNIPKDTPKHLTIIFDRSELMQNSLGESFFNYLRALRDTDQRLSFIFGGRILHPESFGELTDIFWHEPHWIGALSSDDACVAVTRHLTRIDHLLEDSQIEKLIDCVGRHPGLLRYACELIGAEIINLNGDKENIIEQLLASGSIERQCQELWQDLELMTMGHIVRRIAQEDIVQPSPITEILIRCGIFEVSPQGHLKFTSPLFKHYIKGLTLSLSTPN